MYTPQQEIAGKLMQDTAEKVSRVVGELRHELDHIQSTMQDSVSALSMRKADHTLVSCLASAQDAVQGAGAGLAREVRDLEETVQSLHNLVMRLDASW